MCPSLSDSSGFFSVKAILTKALYAPGRKMSRGRIWCPPIRWTGMHGPKEKRFWTVILTRPCQDDRKRGGLRNRCGTDLEVCTGCAGGLGNRDSAVPQTMALACFLGGQGTASAPLSALPASLSAAPLSADECPSLPVMYRSSASCCACFKRSAACPKFSCSIAANASVTALNM